MSTKYATSPIMTKPGSILCDFMSSSSATGTGFSKLILKTVLCGFLSNYFCHTFFCRCQMIHTRNPSAVYVKSQRRIYVFGESSSTKCIDFPPKPFDCTGKPNGDYFHPRECTKFITCSNQLAYERNCPSGLHFDSKHRICNYPEQANCSEN